LRAARLWCGNCALLRVMASDNGTGNGWRRLDAKRVHHGGNALAVWRIAFPSNSVVAYAHAA